MSSAIQMYQQTNASPDSEDPPERWTGNLGQIMNKHSKSCKTQSAYKAKNKADLEEFHRDALEYYEDRRTGKIEGKSFEEWEEPVSHEEAERLYNTENDEVRQAFFGMDYSRGFTGRGVVRGTLERPHLFGPRNERAEESVGTVGGSRGEQSDRPLWRASDEGKVAPARVSKDDEDVGPLGESRNEEEAVGPLRESRDQVMHPAAQSMTVLNNTEDASSSHSATTTPTEPSATLTSSSPPTASLPSAPTKKRARDSEDVEDEVSPSQHKRMRMDDALGIVRNVVSAAQAPKTTVAVAETGIEHSRKRQRSFDDDSDSEDGVTERPPKRRLYEQIKEMSADDEEYITANVANGDDTTLEQPFVEDEAPTSHETEEREDASRDGEAVTAETVWDTAHGINSSCADIAIPKSAVRDVTGQVRGFFLPTRTGLPDRPWTEGEKEDLRVYIQDYKLDSWTLLSQSMTRPEEDLQRTYLEVIKSRNHQAGRPERAGITDRYPDLAPPAPPAPAPERSMKLRSLDKLAKNKKNRLGDLMYDMKATSFPKITKDGRMIDANGNALLGVMDRIHRITKPRQQKLKLTMPKRLPLAEHSNDSESPHVNTEDGDSICHVTKPRQPKLKLKMPKRLPLAENLNDSESPQVNTGDGDSEIEEGEIVESEEQARGQAPCPKDMGEKKGSLSASVKGGEDPEIKQEDSDLEHQVSPRTIPESNKDTVKGPLRPQSAGVSKLCGSSRRGVPRKAALSRR